MFWTMVAVLLVSLLAFWLTREALGPRVRIATGAQGGLYHKLADVLAPHLEERIRRPVDVVTTAGSRENLRLLLGGEVELALLQGELAGEDGVRALTPLYQDVLHVVVRKGSGIDSLGGLPGRRIAIGAAESGMRVTAETVLGHYGVPIDAADVLPSYFGVLAEDPSVEAALVTTGLLNPDLERLLATGEYSLLPVADAEALAVRNPFLQPYEIPSGLYCENPAVPLVPVQTVATTTVLAALAGTPDRLVKATLSALYENDLRREVPILMRQRQVALWDELPQHPAAVDYFRPYSGLGILANMMESLAALKELLFALGAGLYLGWTHWQRMKARERARAMHVAKEYLDTFFEETMRIEKAQMVTDEPGRLRYYLDQLTATKLRALEELTHEDLRADTSFTIFLQQCANLSRKIQAKIDFVSRGQQYPKPTPPATDPSA